MNSNDESSFNNDLDFEELMFGALSNESCSDSEASPNSSEDEKENETPSNAFHYPSSASPIAIKKDPKIEEIPAPTPSIKNPYLVFQPIPINDEKNHPSSNLSNSVGAKSFCLSFGELTFGHKTSPQEKPAVLPISNPQNDNSDDEYSHSCSISTFSSGSE